MKVEERLLILVLMFAVLSMMPSDRTAYAHSNSLSDQDLAQKFAPVLYFHPAELFRPQSVDVFVNTARLREQRRLWFDINILPKVSITDLFDYSEDHYFLDIWYGNEGTSDFMNYESHRAYYQNVLSPEAGGPPIVTYARVVRDESQGHIAIQYWFFYYYNDWFNKHEGDWEMGEVILNETGEPEWFVLSQHHGGTRRPWSTVTVENDTHPVIHVALGSHANYFWGNEIYPNGMDIGNTRVEIMDRTGTFGRIIPEVHLIPRLTISEDDQSNLLGWEWILFGGHWGETAPQSDFGGPYGPAYKGEQWERPYAWGLSQPLDTETWYANRLRVKVIGDTAQIKLKNSNGEFAHSAEIIGNLALLHRDPLPGEGIIAEIEIAPGQPYSIIATWPDSSSSQVTHYSFDNLPISPAGLVTLTLSAGESPALIIAGVPGRIMPSTIETDTIAWDAPDLIWMAGFLPGSEVIKGLMISLLAGWLPALLLVGVLYWTDRYEKEPAGLLATTFLWGAVPALLIAIFARLFFRLPPELLGTNAIEAIGSGLFGPFVEETLKGLVVLFIAMRYRREFDNVQDGIIYGGMAGIGFAMNANIISYIGSFLMRGFAGLSVLLFLEGILFALNHALYSAIFGAGLGYARLSTKRWRRWVIPLAAYLFAILIHFFHNLIIRNSIGLSLFTVVLTLIGVLAFVVVAAWSLKRQHRCLKVELVDELPEDLYQIIVRPSARVQAQWQTLREEGFWAWRRSKYLYQLCAELAFKRMQTHIFPDEEKIKTEAQVLRDEIRGLSGEDRME
jgi:RsiW-degrading membrane proteinase PrsW (M82 family)